MHRTLASLCAGAALVAAPSLVRAQDPALASAEAATAAAMSGNTVTGNTVTAAALTAAPTASATGAAPVATRNVGPSVHSATVALRHRESAAPAPAPVPRANTANNRALVVVGATGLLVGAIVGGDAGTIVMLGSAGIGLYGLYRLLT